MKELAGLLRSDEKYTFSLRKLFEKYGYRQYKMSKFEEYDLYLENKSFLQSESIIAFNDPSSNRLLALKPDITLSIVKNAKDSDVPDKVYYCENVYRSSRSHKEIREIMQVGIEYIGDVDLYSTSEVIALAVGSLETVSRNCIMCISHMGIVTALLDSTEFSYSKKEKLIKLVSSKSAHEITSFCREKGVGEDLTGKIAALATIYGKPVDVLSKVAEIANGTPAKDAVNELKSLCDILAASGDADKIRIDFSVMNDMSYYNGIIFQGFIDEIPCSILSGGRYDLLLKKLGKKSGAIGFAVYLDLLERYHQTEKEYDVDILILYDDHSDTAHLSELVKQFISDGKSVRVQKADDGCIKYRNLLRFTDGRTGND